MATLLGQSRRHVVGLERRPDPRTTELVGGRSINLALSERGLHALEQVGLKESILRLSVPLYGRMIHSPSGRLAFQPYGTRGRSIYSLSRAGLNAALLDAAEQAGATLRFGRRCTGLDLEQGQVVCLPSR